MFRRFTLSGSYDHEMVYFFMRSGEFFRCEADEGSEGRWELRLVGPDGTERVELFESASALDHRIGEVEQELKKAGWSGPHGQRS